MPIASALDDRTAAAVRQALSAASSGRIADACSIGERALADGGDPPTLHAMLGMFRSRTGDFGRAIEHLQEARRARPSDIRIANNLVSALAQQKRHQDALDVLTEELVAADSSLQLLRLRGFLAQSLEQFEAAVADYQRVVSGDPNDWESWNNLGNARRSAGAWAGSVDALRQAAKLNPASAPVRLNLGTALVSAGKFDEAEDEVRRMAEAFGGDAKPLRAMHLLFKLQARGED